MVAGERREPVGPPARFRSLTPAGGTWLRLETDADGALVRAEAGVSLDYDRRLMRITTRDRREFCGADAGSAGEEDAAGRGRRAPDGR